MHTESPGPSTVSDNAEERGWNPSFSTTSEDTAWAALGDLLVFATMNWLQPRESCVSVDLEGGRRLGNYMMCLENTITSTNLEILPKPFIKGMVE